MYERNNRMSVGVAEVSDFIEGIDLFGSTLTMKIRDLYPYRQIYVVKTKEYRPDLIAEEIYGSSKYMAFLMLCSGSVLESFYHGAEISYIPKEYLDSILR